MYYELTDHFRVPAALDRVWAFFSTADNLPLITPPWLRFKVRTPGPITMGEDTLLDYTIYWLGAPVKWRTKIMEWSPPRQFIDLQIRGPYALWLHQHTFADAEGGVECRDRVVYRLPAGAVGRVVHAATVRRQLLDIFRFRRKVIGEQRDGIQPLQDDVQIRRLG